MERRSYDALLEEHINAEKIRDAELKQDIKELKEAVESLIATWNQAKGVITFVKWMVSIAGGVTAFLLFIKDHIK